MQITFNVPLALQRDVEWLARETGCNVEAMLYITAFQGFEEELKQKVAKEQQRKETEKPFGGTLTPIDWHKRDKPAPIDWPKRYRTEDKKSRARDCSTDAARRKE